MRGFALALVLVLSVACVAVASARPSLSRSQAEVIANAVSLQPSDLPSGYNLTPGTDVSTEDMWGNGRVARCMGRLKVFNKQLVDITSANYEKGSSSDYEGWGSEVEVLRSSALVKSDLKLARTSRARRCLTQELNLHPQNRLGRILSATVKPLKPAVPNGAGYAVKIVYKTKSGTYTFNQAVAFFGNGPIEAAIFAVTSPGMPDRALMDQARAAMDARATEQLARAR